MEPPHEEFERTPMERFEDELSGVLRELEQLNRSLTDLDISLAGQIGKIEEHLEGLLYEIKTSSKTLEESVERIWSRMDDGLLDISKEVEALRYEFREGINGVASLLHELQSALLQTRQNYHPWLLLIVLLLGVLVYRLW